MGQKIGYPFNSPSTIVNYYDGLFFVYFTKFHFCGINTWFLYLCLLMKLKGKRMYVVLGQAMAQIKNMYLRKCIFIWEVKLITKVLYPFAKEFLNCTTEEFANACLFNCIGLPKSDCIASCPVLMCTKLAPHFVLVPCVYFWRN